MFVVFFRYVANTYDVESGYPSSATPIHTRITYDYGGAWHRINAPVNTVCDDPKVSPPASVSSSLSCLPNVNVVKWFT